MFTQGVAKQFEMFLGESLSVLVLASTNTKRNSPNNISNWFEAPI